MQKEQTICRGCLESELFSLGEKDGFSLLRCRQCKTVNAAPLPSPTELSAFYQDYKKSLEYAGKKESKLKRCRGRVRRILKAKPPGRRFLDIGCNVGYMTAAAQEMGFIATGIDIDPAAVDVARKNFQNVTAFETLDVADLAARGAQFDIVYTSEVVEHVLDPDAFIASIAKLLTPHGVLYLTTPDGAHFATPRNFLNWEVTCPPEHLTYFSRSGLKALLSRHGLKTEKFQFAFKPGIKLIARKS